MRELLRTNNYTAKGGVTSQASGAYAVFILGPCRWVLLTVVQAGQWTDTLGAAVGAESCAHVSRLQ